MATLTKGAPIQVQKPLWIEPAGWRERCLSLAQADRVFKETFKPVVIETPQQGLVKRLKEILALDVEEPETARVEIDGVIFGVIGSAYFTLHIFGRCGRCGQEVPSPILENQIQVGRQLEHFEPDVHLRNRVDGTATICL